MVARRVSLWTAVVASCVRGLNNGLYFNAPPMGWRSWNCYQGDVTQDKMQRVVDAMVRWRQSHTSLQSLGYVNVGLDDNWQDCQPGNYYHGPDGKPLVNKGRFPDMRGMTNYAHARGMRMGWYFNQRQSLPMAIPLSQPRAVCPGI